MGEGKNRGIWIISERINGCLIDETYELISKAREIADKLNEKLVVIYLGNDSDNEIEEIFEYSVDKVIVLPVNKESYITEDVYQNIYLEVIKEYNPSIILFPATVHGKAIASSLSVKLNSGLVAECIDISISDDSEVIFTRPALEESIMANIKCKDSNIKMCTIRKNVFIKKRNGKKGDRAVINYNCNITCSEKLKIQKIEVLDKSSEENIQKSEIVVAGGRGIGKEGFVALKKFAENIGAAVGGTRAAIEEGWIENEYKIGQSGINISPKVYIAFGISGAIQHMSGVMSSKKIIAINNNEDADIFKYAEYKIVADANDLLPVLVKYTTKK